MKSTWRGYKRKEKMTSREHDKDRAIQHKKRRGTLPKIEFPDKKITSDAEFSDDTSPIQDEKGINYRKDVKNKKNDEVNEAEFPDGTPPDDIEEDVCEKNMTRIKKLLTEKRQNDHMALLLMIWRKVQVKKHDKDEKIVDRKYAECQYGTPPNDVEEGVGGN